MDVVVVGHIASPLTVGVLRGLRATGNRVRFLAQGPCEEDAAALGVADVRTPYWPEADSIRECLLADDDGFEPAALCLITTHLEAAPRADFDLVDAAKGTSLTHVVKFSACGAEISTAKMSQWHREVEKYISDSGCFTFCFLRPNFLFQHLKVFNPSLVQERRFAFPFSEEAEISFVDVRDVIRVALEVITDPDSYTAETYSLTGPQALTMGEVAAAMTEAFPSEAGPVVYEKLTFDETIERWKKLDVHAGWINNFRELFLLADSGKCSGISDDIEVVLERSPVDLLQCLGEHGAFFAAPPPDADDDDEDWDSDEEEEAADASVEEEGLPEPPSLDDDGLEVPVPVPEDFAAERSIEEEDSVEETATAVVHSAVHEAIHEAISEQVEDIVEDAVEEAVEDAIEDAIEDAVEDAVEKTLADKVSDYVRHSIEDAVEDIVEDQIADALQDTIEDAVKEGIEEAVRDAVEEAVEARVVEGVEQSVEDAVAEAVAEQTTTEKIHDLIKDEIEDAVEDAVEDAIDGHVEHAVKKAIEHAVEDIVERAVEQEVERVVEAGIHEAVEAVETAHEEAPADMAPPPPSNGASEAKDLGECSSEESEDEGADYAEVVEEKEAETYEAPEHMDPTREDQPTEALQKDELRENHKEEEQKEEEHKEEEHKKEEEHEEEHKEEEHKEEAPAKQKEEARAMPPKTMSKAQILRAKFEQQGEEPKKPLERVQQGGRDRPISQKLEFAAVANLLTSRPPMPGLGPRAREEGEWNPEDGYEEEEKQDIFVPGFGCYFQPQEGGEPDQTGEPGTTTETTKEAPSKETTSPKEETTAAKEMPAEPSVPTKQPEAQPPASERPAPTPPPKAKAAPMAAAPEVKEEKKDHDHHSDNEAPAEAKKEAPEPPAKKRAAKTVDAAEEEEALHRDPPTKRPKWVADSESDCCQLCKKAFTLLHRRHHCRNCGRLFDADCCDSFIPLPNLRHKNPARVCTPCKRLYSTVYRKAMTSKYRKR